MYSALDRLSPLYEQSRGHSVVMALEENDLSGTDRQRASDPSETGGLGCCPAILLSPKRQGSWPGTTAGSWRCVSWGSDLLDNGLGHVQKFDRCWRPFLSLSPRRRYRHLLRRFLYVEVRKERSGARCGDLRGHGSSSYHRLSLGPLLYSVCERHFRVAASPDAVVLAVRQVL